MFRPVRIVEVGRGAKAYQWIILSPNGREIARSKTVFSRKDKARDAARSAVFAIREWKKTYRLDDLIEDETKM